MIDAAPEGEDGAAWLICDHAFQRRYPFGMSKPFPVPVWPYVRSGYLTRGKTLGGAGPRVRHRPGRAGAARSREFNEHARVGEDPEFGRGTTAFNRGSGDPDHGPTRRWRRSRRRPFYAIKVLPGSFGTFFGLRHGRRRAGARRRTGTPIPGCTRPAATRPT